ncbi:hypothetical protein [Thiospirillum jenense]|uniref:Uncharacterized protein n=1 Tax=Thiospirillum jenense TaxID=1653858 RepID=A0A839HC42_9GAMM|nr:hypothetical protein [Thiospirillum jenense]MBB1124777.1 hypothetical protein [Thiospirillum jenense]
MRYLFSSLAITSVFLITIGSSSNTPAAPLRDPQMAPLLLTLVTTAKELDLYNSRCRKDGAGRYSDNLNKTLVSRYRMTILDVQDRYFPERDYRAAQAQLDQHFFNQLQALGGCAAAKQQGFFEQLRERFDQALAELLRLL